MRRRAVASIGLICLIALISSGWLLRAEIATVELYQTYGSPVARYVSHCRYDPTCSHYALQSLRRDGLWLGNLKIAGRVLMCSPIGWVIEQF